MATPFDHLGRYAVQRRLGAGGFATVWLAYDEKLDSPVAIKVLADNWAGDEAVARRFLEEGRYLRRVDSPHVVSVYDAGELDDGRPYLVMTYADQGTLADRIEMQTMGGSLDVAQARSVVADVASGLQDLHDRDILHRDVKPANVLFRSVRGRGSGGRSVRALVGDLGLGKALDVSSRLTMIAGTPSYVAPEQAAGDPLDARADQYALAALAYRLLAGRPPFVFTSLHQAATPGALEPMTSGRRSFTAEVEEVVRRGLAPQRDDRFESVGDFGDALSDALGRMGAGSANIDLLPGPLPVAPAAPTRSIPEADVETETTPVRLPQPVREDRPLFVDEVVPAPQPMLRPVPQPRPRRRGPVVLGTVLGMVAIAAAAGVATYIYAGQKAVQGAVTVTDATKAISVRVPGDWDQYVNGDGWQPPHAKTSAAALSVGDTTRWNEPSTKAEGVFAGLMPATGLPTALPGHGECVAGRPAWGEDADGHESLTETYTGCPGGVIVERVTQVDPRHVLWTQAHAADLATADRVLNSVRLA